MYLIADSGSTKIIWCLIDGGKSIGSCTTGGFNPYQSGSDEMVRLLETEFTLSRTGISEIWFYGAGCRLPDKKQIVVDALRQYFAVSGGIHVNRDMLAAARSLCGNQPGIACILGTGSNSCYYNGQEIIQNVLSLGYLLGDEGSGSVLGRKLLSDILKNRLPEEIRKTFFDTCHTTLDEILDHVYCKPFPNRYLAQYAKFISANIAYPEMQALVSNSFREFFTCNVMQYEAASQLPVHFTGSIAFHFSDILKKTAEEFGLTVGKITLDPMTGLVEYHCRFSPTTLQPS